MSYSLMKSNYADEKITRTTHLLHISWHQSSRNTSRCIYY